jgi:hypothetical protein
MAPSEPPSNTPSSTAPASRGFSLPNKKPAEAGSCSAERLPRRLGACPRRPGRNRTDSIYPNGQCSTIETTALFGTPGRAGYRLPTVSASLSVGSRLAMDHRVSIHAAGVLLEYYPGNLAASRNRIAGAHVSQYHGLALLRPLGPVKRWGRWHGLGD